MINVLNFMSLPINQKSINDIVITMETSAKTIKNLVDGESCKHFDLINRACLS